MCLRTCQQNEAAHKRASRAVGSSELIPEKGRASIAALYYGTLAFITNQAAAWMCVHQTGHPLDSKIEFVLTQIKCFLTHFV